LHFAPDVETSLEFVAIMANTDAAASRSGRDELSTVQELDWLIASCAFSGRQDHDRRELREVVETRDLVRSMWTLPRDEMVDEINAILREAEALPQLTRHDDLDWHIHATSLEAPLAKRIQVEFALALGDVIRADATDRLRVCEATECDGLLVDFSRNGSKRFCTVRCGNRMNMIAYRERQSAIDN
jgi:predicted RNA-binding Zn ribbon-like protein